MTDRIAELFGDDYVFRPQWYLERYPSAREAVETGQARSAADHFERFGHDLGYRGSYDSPRYVKDPSLYFTGLWTDQPDALERLDRKHDTGVISDTEAEALRHFIESGYLILSNALPEPVLDAAEDALDDIYGGKHPEVKFEWRGGKCWGEGIQDVPAKAHDTHYLSKPIRDAVLHDRVTRYLKLIFDGGVLASQSLGFYLGSGQRVHQDTAYVTYSQPRKFVGVWTALEDVAQGAGELVYVPGSHKIDPPLFADKYFSIHEGLRSGELADHGTENNKFLLELEKRYTEAGLKREHFLAKRGDVLIWSALLAHGGAPTNRARTRKSVVTHFCPADLAPNFFETSKRPRRKHADGVYYSNFAY